MTALRQKQLYFSLLRVTLFAVVTAAAGCANAVKNDPLKFINNPLRETSDRIDAVNHLALSANDHAALKSLDHLVWTIHEPVPLREAAADRLIAVDPAYFQTQLRRNLLDIKQRPMLRFLLSRIEQHHWQNLTGTVIRSWASESRSHSGAKLPERDALAKLYPDQSVKQTLIDAFTSSVKHDSMDVQAAAWTVLSRRLPAEKMREILAQIKPDTLLVRDLKIGAQTLDELPYNREGLLWLVDLQLDHPATWHHAATVARHLTPEQHAGLAIRHIAMLTHLTTDQLAMSRNDLLSLVSSQLARRSHTSRGQDSESQLLEHLPSQTLVAHRKKMCWADLMQVELLMRAMRDPRFSSSVFSQADADRLDKSSEHGGIITWQNNRIIAKAYAPEFRVADRRYIASEKLILNLYVGLAHYHFHVQQYKNAKWAGPGPGDLKLINHLETAAVVFTFINQHTLNVDYYKPGNVVIDLGMLRR